MTERRRRPGDAPNPRSGFPVHVYRLGEEPADRLDARVTPEDRLAMLAELSARAWALTGRPVPTYERHTMPVVVRRLR
jgi:hypothetical protein